MTHGTVIQILKSDGASAVADEEKKWAEMNSVYISTSKMALCTKSTMFKILKSVLECHASHIYDIVYFLMIW